MKNRHFVPISSCTSQTMQDMAILTLEEE